MLYEPSPLLPLPELLRVPYAVSQSDSSISAALASSLFRTLFIVYPYLGYLTEPSFAIAFSTSSPSENCSRSSFVSATGLILGVVPNTLPE